MNSVEVVLGTAQFMDTYGITRSGRMRKGKTNAHSVMDTAHSLGIRTIDTAPTYGDAESIIGLHDWPHKVHTKFAGGTCPQTSLDESLKRLQHDSVEVLYLHDPSAVLVPDSPVIEQAFALVGHGATYLGASVYGTDEFDAAVDNPKITCIQAPLNIMDRHISPPKIRAAAAGGKRIYARSVLLQGLLALDHPALPLPVEALWPAIRRFQALCEESDRRPLEVALKWAQRIEGLSGIVIGAGTSAELMALAGALDSAPLSDVLISGLEDLDLPDPSLCDPRTWC